MRYENLSLVTHTVLQRYPEMLEVGVGEVEGYVEAAFHALQLLCSRLFERDNYTETVRVQGSHIYLHAVPVHEIHSIQTEDGQPVEWFGVDKDLGVVEVSPVYDGKRLVVNYDGGFDPLPHLVVLATADLSVFLYRDKGLIANLPDIRVVVDQLPQSVKLVVSTYKLGL